MKNNFTIRQARLEDAARLLEIYSYYVQETAVSFEWKVPSLANFRGRISRTLKNFPYLVAERDGKILGYAYAHEFIGREAYKISAELTIYLDKDERQQGIGRKLYETLEEILKNSGIKNVYACVGTVEQADEFLNDDSKNFHERLGFRTVGVFKNCAEKFGRRYGMIWMEKILAE